jgi:hypothetical protein
MLQWVSRLSKQLVGHGPREPSVLTPDEIPRDEVAVAAKGPDGPLGDVTVVLTRKRLLLTNKAHTTETLSIPLANVMTLESAPAGIRVAYRDARGVCQELWLGHIPKAKDDDLVWMGDDSWVESVAARILEETGRDVWKEHDPPWYVRGA